MWCVLCDLKLKPFTRSCPCCGEEIGIVQHRDDQPEAMIHAFETDFVLAAGVELRF